MNPIEAADSGEQADALASAQRALRDVRLVLPHLAGLIQVVRLQVDPRCQTAGVFASGRLVVNPSWWLKLQPAEAVFVMAHELLHLALDTHGRQGRENMLLVNIAHDLIINDILENELSEPAPALGLREPGARNHSLEWWVGQLRAGLIPGSSWPQEVFKRRAMPDSLNDLGSALAQAGAMDSEELTPISQGDVFSVEMEGDWYPGESKSLRAERSAVIRATATKAVSLGASRERMEAAWNGLRGFGDPAGEHRVCFGAVKVAYRAPWERYLQAWFDGVSQCRRTYARASRRGADRADDVILAGRHREGQTLHLVLDTSGSMYHELPRILGIIAAFAESNHVDEIHLVQADGHDPVDEWIPNSSLPKMTLRGLGGGNLVAPIEHLAADARIEAVVVVTDGDEPFPAVEPPFQVLWALPQPNPRFEPSYGTILVLE